MRGDRLRSPHLGNMELLLLLTVLLAASGLLLLRADRRSRIVAAGCALLAVGGWSVWKPGGDEVLEAAVPGEVRDGGFVSSAACRACHPEEYRAWHRSFHRTMTQVATPASVLGSFDDVELEKKKKKSGCGPLAGFMENLAEKQKEHMKKIEKGKTRSTPRGRKKGRR